MEYCLQILADILCEIQNYGQIPGLHAISALTMSGDYSLRVDMIDNNGNASYADYHYFRVENATTFYKLIVDDNSGTAGIQ